MEGDALENSSTETTGLGRRGAAMEGDAPPPVGDDFDDTDDVRTNTDDEEVNGMSKLNAPTWSGVGGIILQMFDYCRRSPVPG